MSESAEPARPAPGPTAPPELPLTFRQELLPHVYTALAAGWSCAVIGLAGGGLSNLMRFAAEPRVSAHYLGQEAANNTLLVYIEADRLLSAPSLFAGLARQVAASAHRQHWARAEQAALRSLAAAPPGGALAEPAEPLAGMLAFLCGEQHRRVIFIGDEFDAILALRPAGELRELRALRDTYKYELAFLLGLRREPGRLAAARPGEPQASAGAAKLAELFEQHTFPLRPYSQADAEIAIARKTVGWPQAPNNVQLDQLYRASGGHAKLLVACLVYLQPRLHLPWANIERGLLADPGLAQICAATWQDLEPAERQALWQLAAEQTETTSPDGLARLELRGLAIGGPASIFSTVFEAFVRGQTEPPAASAEAEYLGSLRDPAAAPRW